MSDPDKWGQTVLAGGAGAVAAAFCLLGSMAARPRAAPEQSNFENCVLQGHQV